MKPYYDEGGITIYHGDCREILPSLDPVDLVLTDPPYNVGIDYGAGTDDARPDYAAWCADWFASARSLARVVAITPGIANIGMWWSIEPPTWVVAWHKPAAMGRGPFGFNNWEPVLVWGKPLGRMTTDVVTAPIVSDPSVDGHPCPKPLKWASALLEMLAPPIGATIIDPFAGSGTTLRAAADRAMRAIGIEAEERYCEIAADRFGQQVFDLGMAA